MPDLTLVTDQGTAEVFGLLRQAHPVLINLGAEGLTATPTPWADRVDYVAARYEPDRPGGHWHVPVFGEIPAVDAVLVRPDGYVAWVNPATEPVAHDALTAALTRWLGPGSSSWN
ncbi:hypothetical protein [Kibdelosporangium aridum]|uniref:aromatic-ring hydroxylase C-terminal domain-containing protein n=1 Tax=Kibdelosporangium aridum TaxID=2030 RepID=UPI00056D29E7|nr:hypothetical protein [Kibdelosporangium aridum]